MNPPNFSWKILNHAIHMQVQFKRKKLHSVIIHDKQNKYTRML